MKRLLTFGLIIGFGLSGFAQIQKEGSTIIDSSPLRIETVEIAPGEVKLLAKDESNSKFTLYNLDCSVYKTITFPQPHIHHVREYKLFYVHKTLFDCDDSNLEYLVTLLLNNSPWNTVPGKSQIAIYRENGDLLSLIDSSTINNTAWLGNFFSLNPVVNTPEGAKLITYKNDPSLPVGKRKVEVYGLCASEAPKKPTALQASNLDDPHPNPTSNTITLDYELPEKVQQGVLIVYDLNGRIVQNFTVDKTFSSLLLNASEYPVGTYFYTITAGEKVIKGKKFMVQP